jgi:hypothetical protein
MLRINRLSICGFAVILSILSTILLIFPTNKIGPNAGQTECSNNLKRIANAICEYQLENNGCLPPRFIPDANGNPLHSWRVLLLKYLDKNLYESYKFDEPWNSPTNLRLTSQRPLFYRCPNSLRKDKSKNLNTCYLAVTGLNSAFPGEKPKMNGEIFSGMIVIVEVLDSNIHWAEPRDLDVSQIDYSCYSTDSLWARLSSQDPSGPGAIFGDLKIVRLTSASSK